MNKALTFSSIFGAVAMMAANDMFLCSADGDEGGSGGTVLTGGGGDPAQVVDTGREGTLYGEEPTDKKDDAVKDDDKSGEEDAAAKKAAEDKAKADDEKPEWKEYVNDPDKTDEENAAAKAEHDKTKPDDKDKGDKTEPVKAEEYEFVEVPEGFELDPEVDKEFRDFAAKRGWSKEDVKDLSALQVKLYAKQSEAHAERVAEWGESLKTDKEIGGRAYAENTAKAREAKLAFFPPEVDAILDKTGLGSHPAIVKGFVRIGKAMGEMQTLPGKGKTANTSILENLYGSE